jgi:hypothetical protein
MLMRKEFPEHYDFFPVTYVLPYEMNHFRKQFFKEVEPPEKKEEDDPQGTAAASLTKPNEDAHSINLNLAVNGRERINDRTMKRKPIIEKKKLIDHKMFIVKPENESQGKGIFLTNTWEDVNYGERLIA